jgi:metal-responsive CopG/Arc/MetJ family transcriptional regulator
MPRVATKVAVSIPAELSRAVEAIRRESGKSRSAIVQDALKYWLRSQANAAMVRDYQAGYRRAPETAREVKAAEAAAMHLLTERL